MKITVIAHTEIKAFPSEIGGTGFEERESDFGTESSIDLLGELAGRSCYKSWELPNPSTATNEGYMENIQHQMHYSVMEHGAVTFWVEGVSRALLLELERHRHISFSVESQRYVNTRKWHTEPVYPPLWAELGDEGVILSQQLLKHYEASLVKYDSAYTSARDQGFSIKKSREAARAFLLESTPVDLFVSGNIRAWRDVLGKRHSEHADEEIQEFAAGILSALRDIAPNSFQDISDTPSA